MNKSIFDFCDLKELSNSEKKNTNGGVLPIIVGIIALSITLGYSDGRRDKHAND